MEVAGWARFGAEGKPAFWFGPGAPARRLHVAFSVANREQVPRFYDAALAAGGKDNGPPGIREIYHPNYSGASCSIRTGTTSKPFATSLNE